MRLENFAVAPARWLTNVSVVFVAIMMLHIVADVSGRYLFNSPLPGTLEIVAAYYMVAIVFFPLAYSTHRGGQIAVELFTQGLSHRVQNWMDAVIAMAGVAYMGVFTWHTLKEALRRTATGEMRETADDLVSIWPSRWILPIAFAVMAIYLCYQAVTLIQSARVESVASDKGAK